MTAGHCVFEGWYILHTYVNCLYIHTVMWGDKHEQNRDILTVSTKILIDLTFAYKSYALWCD